MMKKLYIILALAAMLVPVRALANPEEAELNANDATDIVGEYTAEKPAEGSSSGEAAKYQPLPGLNTGTVTLTNTSGQNMRFETLTICYEDNCNGDEPQPGDEKEGDYNGDGYIDIQDVYDLLDYIHAGGR